MAKAIIKLAYKQVMDVSSSGDFEKNVLFASYQEFLLKSQVYNPEGKFKIFDDLKANDGRANPLHYKLSFSVGHFIETLKGKIPHLTDNLDNSVVFETPKFELIASDLTSIDAHKVAITYTTPELTLLNSFGEYLVVSSRNTTEGTEAEAFTIKMQDGLSVVNYQPLVQHHNLINI